jgi:hypothetical protein
MVLLVLVLPVLMGVFVLVMERLEAALLGDTPPDLDEELPVQDSRRQDDLGRLSRGSRKRLRIVARTITRQLPLPLSVPAARVRP